MTNEEMEQQSWATRLAVAELTTMYLIRAYGVIGGCETCWEYTPQLCDQHRNEWVLIGQVERRIDDSIKGDRERQAALAGDLLDGREGEVVAEAQMSNSDNHTGTPNWSRPQIVVLVVQRRGTLGPLTLLTPRDIPWTEFGQDDRVGKNEYMVETYRLRILRVFPAPPPK